MATKAVNPTKEKTARKSIKNWLFGYILLIKSYVISCLN
jgi:hypothetical protein